MYYRNVFRKKKHGRDGSPKGPKLVGNVGAHSKRRWFMVSSVVPHLGQFLSVPK